MATFEHEIEEERTTPKVIWNEIVDENDDEVSPIEEVRLVVPTTDDTSLPVWTFRMWVLGVISCVLLSFVNQFFSYRTEPLMISQVTAQVAALPLGQFMAKVLPTTQFSIGSFKFSLNPGPFNIKEHVLISIFAQAGYAFGGGNAYAVGIVDIIKALYRRQISFLASWILVVTTQVLGYGWAGILRKFAVEPSNMWWPSSLVQVTLFQAMHKRENHRGITRGKFFVMAMVLSFIWYIVPGFLFPTIMSLSVLCFAFPKSVTAQQVGSGMYGLGIGSFSFDWATIAGFLGSPLVSPFFAIVNVFVGYVLFVYVVFPTLYWGYNTYDAKTFPFISSSLYASNGQEYNTSAIVTDKFELDVNTYEKQGRVNLALFFAVSYGLGFANVASTLTHCALFYGREICNQLRSSYQGKMDIHSRLMKRYKDIPGWWFYLLLLVTVAVSLCLCIFMRDQVQLPWWGLLVACVLAFFFTLPIAIITATTNQTPGLNIITEYLMGLAYPGHPIANVCFKTYGYISMTQAISFLNDFKLGHYMKIPPRSMFIVQLIGTVIASTVNIGVAWWLLTSIENICHPDLLPENSPWTCPGDRVFFSASVIWGLVGPKRIFGSLGNYSPLNWFFLGGIMGPVVVWLLHKAFPKQKWIPLINLPVLLGATAMMPPASSINYTSWIVVGTFFNYYIFRYRKKWWQKYNYVLSAAMDAGVAFMGVVIHLAFTMRGIEVNWWGSEGDRCPLASCPTAKGVQVDGCPTF
ncbi:oligopeptide transporter 4-like [Aristolochia californica]|uniref:oligopeptide transporter 4-like n=1 Tax=Aristolochia californica TaxID=171875 RepID=UPI0035E02A46